MQRRGRNCVLKKFPDNMGLYSMSFIFFYFPFSFSRADIGSFFFFSGANFPPYLLKVSLSASGSGLSASSIAQTCMEPACASSQAVCMCRDAEVAWMSIQEPSSHFCLADASQIWQIESFCFSQKISLFSGKVVSMKIEKHACTTWK